MTKIINHPSDLLTMVGDTMGPTDWLEMTQQRVNQFADATGDHQWIHIDPERAAAGPFGACIAHGYLTLSLASKFLPELMTVNNTTMGVNYGCNKVRFPNAVKVGQRIRGTAKIINAEQKGKAVQSIAQVTIEVQGETRPACVVDTISLFYYV